MECHLKVSPEVNKPQALMKLSTPREVLFGFSTTKLKTLMEKRNLILPANASVNPTTRAERPVELIELSKEDLQQIVGGTVAERRIIVYRQTQKRRE
jgi:bacteriocin-like protein